MTIRSGTEPNRRHGSFREDVRVTRPVQDRTSTNRTQAAAAPAARADEAFWAGAADAYPEVATGDLAPGQAAAWKKARGSAGSGWVADSVPGAGTGLA